MKLVQAREWADIYLSSPHLSQEAYSLESMLIDAYTAGWREGWEDGEVAGFNRGIEYAQSVDVASIEGFLKRPSARKKIKHQ